jgi:hypothetical protein
LSFLDVFTRLFYSNANEELENSVGTSSEHAKQNTISTAEEELLLQERTLVQCGQV